MAPRQRLRRSLVAFLVCAAALALTATSGARTALRVTSALPAWRAPGGTLVVDGWAGGEVPVALTVRGKSLGETVSGPLGRFHLVARMPVRAGTYAVTLSAGAEARPLGRVLVRAVVLDAAGDFTTGEGISALPSAWDSVGPLLRAADIATLNLEGAVSERGTPVPNKAYHFRGPRSTLARAVGAAGLDVLTVANNHALDYGPDAFADTLEAARSLGVRTVGGGATSTLAHVPALVEAGGLRIAFLGYTDIVPSGFAAGTATPGVARADPRAISADVRLAAARADIVVCWFHWGIERTTTPTGRQEELARACLAAGAKIVLGAHPHVLQPIVQPAPGTLVAYSLGNFVFPASAPGSDQTGILELRLGAAGVRSATLHRARIVAGAPRLG